MIPNITRGSNPAGIIRYLFGPGRKNEHARQRMLCASNDLVQLFDMQGLPLCSFDQIGAVMDLPYRNLERNRQPFPPDRKNRENPDKEHGRHRIWHCSLSIKSAHGVLSDGQWEQIVHDFMERMKFSDSPMTGKVTWVAVRHGLSANGNDHVHLVVQLAAEKRWLNAYNDQLHAQKTCRLLEQTHDDLTALKRRQPLDAVAYQYAQWKQWAEWKARYDWIEAQGESWESLDKEERIQLEDMWENLEKKNELVKAVAASTMPRIHVARLVEACALASDTEDEFIRRIRREGLQIDPFLRKGTNRYHFDSPEQVTGYRITWRSKDGWKERFSTRGLGDDFRLKHLRSQWRHNPRTDALTVLEWKAAMGNHMPAINDGAERKFENLSTHDLERLIDIAFMQAARLQSSTPEEQAIVIRDGIRTFDQLRSRYGEVDYGLTDGIQQQPGIAYKFCRL